MNSDRDGQTWKLIERKRVTLLSRWEVSERAAGTGLRE